MTTAPTPDDLPESVEPARTLPTFTKDTPVPYAAEPADMASAPGAPAAPRPAARWSAKRTVLAGGLALVLGLVGAVGAAAALRAGSTGGDDDGFRTGRVFGPGGQGSGSQDPRHGGFPNFGPGQQLNPGGHPFNDDDDDAGDVHT